MKELSDNYIKTQKIYVVFNMVSILPYIIWWICSLSGIISENILLRNITISLLYPMIFFVLIDEIYTHEAYKKQFWKNNNPLKYRIRIEKIE